VLRDLLTRPEYATEFVISGLSGTSGGALCAALAWSQLLRPTGTPVPPTEASAIEQERKRAAKAAEALDDFWEDLACDGADDLQHDGGRAWWQHSPFDYLDAIGNAFMVGSMRWMPAFETNCKVVSKITKDRMHELLRRHVKIDNFERVHHSDLVLRIGATNIVDGYTDVLQGESCKGIEDIYEMLLASASIPPLFEPTKIKDRYYWDGLFSHNPPIDCFTNLNHDPYKPTPIDEIWVIQINPDACDKPPVTMAEIVDRRNELLGNLTLSAELYHIDAMNALLTDRTTVPQTLKDELQKIHKEIKLRVVGLQKKLDFASKYERSHAHIRELMELGKAAASGFLTDGSIWKCDHEGVQNSAVHPSRIGHRDTLVKKQPDLAFCPNWTCPASGICNTMPLLQMVAENTFDVVQRSLDYSGSAVATH
jgi:NTE family protein